MLFLNPPCRAELERFVFEKAEMGVPFRITLYAGSEAKAKEATDAAFRRVEQLNAILSDYDPDSELSHLSQSSGNGAFVPVGEDLWRVLSRSQELAAESNGAFDVTIGPMVNLWRRMRRRKELPSPSLIAEMRARVGFQKMMLDRENHTASLSQADMRLDLGGIAKGYVADEALKVLVAQGCPSALIAASGDLAAGDPPPGAGGWSVALENLDAGAPQEVILLAHQGVSTSGDAYQFVEIDGTRYSHIVDPRTGIGLTGRSLVTVVAENGFTADGLDTAIDLLGPEKGFEFAVHHPEAAVRMQWLAGKETHKRRTKNWGELRRVSQKD